MRSNIARTCVSSKVPGAVEVLAPIAAATVSELLELGEEVDQVVELLRGLLRELLERRHRRRRVDQRRGDGRRSQLVADLGQGRTGPVVAVLTDDVAGQTSRLPDHELARIECLDLGGGQV